jgi:hypothetical protein
VIDGYHETFWPTSKKTALTPYLRRMDRTFGVYVELGPSSKVR